jgi:hypothetical protein
MGKHDATDVNELFDERDVKRDMTTLSRDAKKSDERSRNEKGGRKRREESRSKKSGDGEEDETHRESSSKLSERDVAKASAEFVADLKKSSEPYRRDVESKLGKIGSQLETLHIDLDARSSQFIDCVTGLYNAKGRLIAERKSGALEHLKFRIGFRGPYKSFFEHLHKFTLELQDHVDDLDSWLDANLSRLEEFATRLAPRTGTAFAEIFGSRLRELNSILMDLRVDDVGRGKVLGFVVKALFSSDQSDLSRTAKIFGAIASGATLLLLLWGTTLLVKGKQDAPSVKDAHDIIDNANHFMEKIDAKVQEPLSHDREESTKKATKSDEKVTENALTKALENAQKGYLEDNSWLKTKWLALIAFPFVTKYGHHALREGKVLFNNINNSGSPLAHEWSKVSDKYPIFAMSSVAGALAALYTLYTNHRKKQHLGRTEALVV